MVLPAYIVLRAKKTEKLPFYRPVAKYFFSVTARFLTSAAYRRFNSWLSNAIFLSWRQKNHLVNKMKDAPAMNRSRLRVAFDESPVHCIVRKK